ncbi:Exopolysaccharide production protein ExoF precursor (plasmid) [Sinorhizobium sojae CCBAU 05684]|uniref:Exopolysaccharide production protein ExoF n=1 Tax=Sinorhizobium sojae CCBAU 05684 TaxID=716928 RepID=A0A249PJY3_9HYPH|nr:polysaccharide biosynthesis/export family protein [Sinorhizobium sojae]ASY65994.1 Exopolysaccharide production protein ExoF precursor [Sinorhizobium sojae CCBAU 05684]
MNVSARAYHTFLRNLLFVTALALLGGATTVAAGTPELAPQTKIRLTIVQWMPTKGEYRQWALGGEFVVSDTGAISVPVIGTVVVGNFDKTRLAAEIAKRLQAKIGLVEAPEATIEIVEYPPVYVVGNVAKPGEYRFRPGLTVLQALAMSGGEFRRTSSNASGDEIALIGELRVIDAALLRSNAKIARLQAEISGAKEVRFARPLNADSMLAAAVENQERIIFATRANVLARQSKSFSELRELLDQEIRVLEEKVDGAEASIKAAERELKAVRKLVEGGLAVASRQSDLERELAGYRANRLDYLTAIMRARQSISEATRNLEGLSDHRQAEIATAIQSEQASLEQLKLKRATTEKLLFDKLSADGNSAQHGNDASGTFIIARRKDGKTTEFPASEMTTLMPGDVIRVVRSVRQDLAVSQVPQSPSLSADSQSGRASQ